MIDNKHCFALYYPDISSHKARSLVLSAKVDVAHRIMHVLRLSKNEEIILFDREHHATCHIDSVSAKDVVLTIQKIVPNVVYKPVIIGILPLLKREAFDEAIYLLTEAGVSDIQLVSTKKAHRAWGGAKERERIERVITAAAEQSKNFSFPRVIDPVPLEKVVTVYSNNLMVGAPEGERLSHVIARLEKEKPQQVAFLVGPEADFTSDEKAMLRKGNSHFVSLTPTILRAQQASFLGASLLRSVLKN